MGSQARTQDVAFVRLSPRASTGYSLYPLLHFYPTDIPWYGNSLLYIVGHPKNKGDEGRRMQEGSGVFTWDLGQDRMLLDHRISTCAGRNFFKHLHSHHVLMRLTGQSGAPVLLPNKKEVVAVHVSGSRSRDKNFACPLGTYGVGFGPYLRFFDGQGGFIVGGISVHGAVSVQHITFMGKGKTM